MLSSATMHKPGTQTPGAPGWWDSAPNSVVVYTIHIGTCNSVHVCIQTSFFCAFWRAEQNGCSELGWKFASFGLINLCDCICKWYRHMASLHPSWSAATPSLGWKKVFPCITALHKSIGQKRKDVPSNLSTQSVTRSVGTVDAEMMTWYIAGTELISGNRQRRSKGEDLTQTLFQNLNLNQVSSQLFSTFTSFLSLSVYSECSLKHKKSSESQWTQLPGAAPFQLPDQIFWKTSAEWSPANPLQMLCLSPSPLG